jgi:hypothetical protein
MEGMTTFERMQSIYKHEVPDQVPITDGFWDSTISRWQIEGMPIDVDIRNYLGLDHIAQLDLNVIDTSPRFEEYVIEEADQYRIEHDRFGITK